MLSLPPIFPRDARTQSNSYASFMFRPPSAPSIFDTQTAPQHLHQQQPRPRPATTHRTLYTHIEHQSRALSARRNAIARFGATWLRPPGCPKTLQAISDEAAEREEQEMLARREREMQEQQMAAEEIQRQIQRQQEGIREVLEGQEAEHDLDDDVPEGEELGMGVIDEDDEDEEDDGEEDEYDQNRFFEDTEGEEGMEGDEGDGDDAGNQSARANEVGMPQLTADMDIDRDLDADIVDADRSWQHTDTDLEDPSSFLQSQRHVHSDFGNEQSIRMARALHVTGDGSMRLGAESIGHITPVQGTPSLLESSWIGSSPGLPQLRSSPGRAQRTANAFRNRLMREASRGRG